MIFTPHDYQEEDIDFLLNHPEAVLMEDMGLGKTIEVLDAAHTLFACSDIRGVLVVAPLRVARLSWPLEVLKWDHIKNFRVQVLHGPNKLQRLQQPAEIYTINYEGLIWLADALKKVPTQDWPFDMIVWDELSKMKNHDSKRMKRMRHFAKKFTRRVGLTGTPTPKGMHDLYGEYLVIDLGKALGHRVGQFRSFFCTQTGYMGREWKVTKRGEKVIFRRIAPITIRRSAKDHLSLPPVQYIEVDVNFSAKDRKKYDKLEEDMFLQLEDENIHAFSAAALSNKCRQFTAGVVFRDDGERYEFVNDAKLKSIEKIRKKEKGEPMLVSYAFRPELEALKKRFPEVEVFSSGMSAKNEKKLEEAWNSGKISMLAAYPSSIGYGLNLQRGGHVIVHPSLPWSQADYKQFNARLWRQGQKEEVRIYNLICSDTVDEVVVEALNRKARTESSLFQALQVYRDSKRN